MSVAKSYIHIPRELKTNCHASSVHKMDHSRSSTYPPEKGSMDWSNDNKNTQQVAPYDPSRWATPPPQGDRVGEGTLVLVDENGNQVGALGEHINVAGVVPGSQGSFLFHFETCLCQDRLLTRVRYRTCGD